MKVKVIKEFIDKNTGKKHLKNAVLDLSDQRIKEISKKGRYIQVIEEATVADKDTKKENK